MRLRDGADVLLHGAADGLVLVGVDHRADALAGEDLGQERLVDPAVDEVGAADAMLAGADAMLEFRDHVVGNLGLVLLEVVPGIGDGNLGGLLAALGKAVAVGDEDELRGLERLSDFERRRRRN